jgi:cyclopropane fatty-acyl-phospholipid synthase-like methyltransferase
MAKPISNLISGRHGLKWRLLPFARFLFLLAGQRWVDFYAWMLDRQERNNNLRAILNESERRSKSGYHKGLYDLSAAEQHVKFMRSEGLAANHSIIDFGCGFGRTAIPLIRFLDPEKYTGVEISKERIRIAKEYVAHERLQDKNPRFVLNRNLSMPYAMDDSVDMIWALAVVSHMPMSDIKQFLSSAFRVLRRNGIVLFDYIIAEKHDKTSVKDFRYSTKAVEDAARIAGFHVASIDVTRNDVPPEWKSPGAGALRLDKP